MKTPRRASALTLRRSNFSFARANFAAPIHRGSRKRARRRTRLVTASPDRGSSPGEMNMKSDKPSKPRKPAASPDELVKVGKKGSIELTEQELKKASGGVVNEKVGPD
jgi:hypothetical protein